MNLLLTGAWQGAMRAIPQIETMGHKAVFLQAGSQGSGSRSCGRKTALWPIVSICGIARRAPCQAPVKS
nr:hypothetical protein [Oscillospiraceae bacterium]